MPKTLDQRLEIRLPSAMVRQARRRAKAESRPLSEIVRELLSTWLAEQTQPAQAIK